MRLVIPCGMRKMAKLMTAMTKANAQNATSVLGSSPQEDKTVKSRAVVISKNPEQLTARCGIVLRGPRRKSVQRPRPEHTTNALLVLCKLCPPSFSSVLENDRSRNKSNDPRACEVRPNNARYTPD